MAIEPTDRELIDLSVDKRIADSLREARPSVVSDVIDKLLADERFKAAKTALYIDTEEQVEKSLKKKYTFIAIITAALVGGAAAGITQAFISAINLSAVNTLNDNMAAIKAYNRFITESQDQVRRTAEAFKPLKDSIESEQLKFSEQNAKLDAQQLAVQSNLDALRAATETISTLNSGATRTGAQSTEISGDIAKLNNSIKIAQNQLNNSKYRIYLHYGNSNISFDNRRAIESNLRSQGYVFIGSDNGPDAINGSRVDYFNNSDCAAAVAIANSISGVVTGNRSTVSIHRDLVVNPAGTIGVWISDKPMDVKLDVACPAPPPLPPNVAAP